MLPALCVCMCVQTTQTKHVLIHLIQYMSCSAVWKVSPSLDFFKMTLWTVRNSVWTCVLDFDFKLTSWFTLKLLTLCVCWFYFVSSTGFLLLWFSAPPPNVFHLCPLIQASILFAVSLLLGLIVHVHLCQFVFMFPVHVPEFCLHLDFVYLSSLMPANLHTETVSVYFNQPSLLYLPRVLFTPGATHSARGQPSITWGYCTTTPDNLGKDVETVVLLVSFFTDTVFNCAV